ncbi:MAG: hypothetical protein LIO79_05210 [Rikenellaceae bacterium]|nr:hypothetical protein [Rikenellaceae bacterium]
MDINNRYINLSLVKNLLVSVLCVCLFASCKSDDEYLGLPGTETVGLALYVSQFGETRAMDDDNECFVDEIDVLLFDAATKVFKTRAIGRNITDGTDRTIKQFQVDLPYGDYDLMVLANSHTEVDAAETADLLEGYTKDQIAKSIKFSETGKWDADQYGTFRAFPMWGEVENVTIDAATDDLYDKTINMMRSVVRIDVELDESFSRSLGRIYYYIESVRLYMPNDEGQVIPDYTNVTTDNSSGVQLPIADAPSVPSTANAITSPIIYIPSTKSDKYNAEIYTMEANVGSLQTWDENTCLVIGIGYDPAGGTTRAVNSDDSIHYYRVDFIKNYQDGVGNFVYIPLLRNHLYKVNVLKVNNYGFYDPDDAWRSEAYGFSYEVSQHSEEKLETGDIGDAFYYLDISQTYFEVSGKGLNDPSGFFYITVDTNHPDGWTYTPSDNWIVIISDIENGGIFVLIDPNPSSQQSRTGTIEIKAGNLTNRIRIVQDPGSGSV